MSRKVPMDVNGIMLFAGIAFLYLPLAWLLFNSLLVTGADGGWGRAAVFGRAADGSWMDPVWLSPGGELQSVASGEVRCGEDGMAGEFACSDVDLMAFLSIEMIGGASANVSLVRPQTCFARLSEWTAPEPPIRLPRQLARSPQGKSSAASDPRTEMFGRKIMASGRTRSD